MLKKLELSTILQYLKILKNGENKDLREKLKFIKMSRKQKTQRQREQSLKLGKENDKLRWVYVGEPLKVHSYILGQGWYEMTKTEVLADKYRYTFKKRGFKDYFIISDKDYKNIIKKFSEFNKHLI